MVMKKNFYAALIVLFTCGVDVAAQNNVAEANIQQEYDAAKQAHKQGEMIEAGNRYCKVLDYYHQKYGNESLQYAEILKSVSVYCNNNLMHQEAAIAASASFNIYAKNYAEGMKHLATYSDLADKMNSVGPENVDPQDLDSIQKAIAVFELERQKFITSAANKAKMMTDQSPLTFKNLKHTDYESSTSLTFQLCMDEFLSLEKEGERLYANFLLWKGQFYQRADRPDQAQTLFLELLEKTEDRLSIIDLYYLKNDIIAYYLSQGQVEQAKKMLQELGCPDTKIPSGVPELVYAITLNLWANVAILEGEQEVAAKYLDLSFKLHHKYAPSLHQMMKLNKMPRCLSAMCFTARLYAQTQQIDRASEIYREALKIFEQIYMNQGLERARPMRVWDIVAGFFDEVHRFAWKYQRYDFLYDQVQLTKSLFSTPVSYQTRTSDLYKDTVWRAQKERMSALLRSPAFLNSYLRGDVTAHIITAIQYDNLMTQSSKRWPQKKTESIRPLSQEELSAALNRQEAAIDFITLDIDSVNKQYAAWVVTSDSQSLAFIPLCMEQELKGVLDKPIHQRCRELYQLVWQPLEAAVNGRSHLYLSSSGLLNQISFAGIETPDGTLCDKYTIRNIRSIGLIDRLKKYSIDSMSQIKNFYLYGGIDFGPLFAKASHTRGQGFSYLPGSKEEMDGITRILSPKWEVKAFTGKEATEEQFLSLSYKQEAPCVIHLSTHGFYLPFLREESTDESELTELTEMKSYASFYDPSLRSGFALSGANQSWNKGRVPIDLYDGVLTGHEIVGINLSNTELVVLSACNTGMEEMRSGIFSRGLQNSFFKAGARAVMASLWEVPDKETGFFMKEFYAQWMSGVTLSQAFVNTQRMMRKAYPDDPEKWAGFILME